MKYIMNIDCINELCAFDIKSGSFHFEYNKNGVIKPDIGFFTRIQDDIYGIVASLNGPIFFRNQDRYLLLDLDYKFEYKSINDIYGNFKFLVDNKIIVDLVYNKPLFTDFDPWNAEEDVDFFQWLCQDQVNETAKKRFHEFYTRD